MSPFPFVRAPHKTSIMLVLLSVFVLNLTWGAAHLAFEHDSSLGHRQEEDAGHGHDQPGHSSHSAQDHAQEMLLPRAGALLPESGHFPVLPPLALTTADTLLQTSVLEWVETPSLPAPWKQVPGSQRGPPKYS